MKKITLLVIVFWSFQSISQTKDGFFFDLNAGARFGGEKSLLVTMSPGFHLDGGMGYMFSNTIGIKGELGMDWFKTIMESDLDQVDRSGMGRGSLMAVLSLSELIGVENKSFTIRLNAGLGLSSISNPNWKLSQTDSGVEFKDPFIKGNDDMIHLILGLNHQYHINENVSINVNISLIGLLKQDFTMDRFNNVTAQGMTSISNAAIGLSYRLGKQVGASRID